MTHFSGSNLPEPILDCVLRAGDLLYFPRGFIHQGNALENEHSLHITVSMFQKHSYAHLMSEMFPLLIQNMKEKNPEACQSLPSNCLDICGASNFSKTSLSNSSSVAFDRQKVIETSANLIVQMAARVSSVIDQAVDKFSLK